MITLREGWIHLEMYGTKNFGAKILQIRIVNNRVIRVISRNLTPKLMTSNLISIHKIFSFENMKKFILQKDMKYVR